MGNNTTETADEWAEERARMLTDILDELDYTHLYTGRAALAPRVMAAMAAVPREEFVPGTLGRYAYSNGPLAIGRGQTISQPFIVAFMTDLLAPRESDTVLEVGTGSGYQAAILARLAKQVYSLEIIPELAQAARERLTRLGFANVTVLLGDGGLGLPEAAPFAGILVTAAAPRVPPALIEQLAPGGRLVIPVGRPGGIQELCLLEKDATGRMTERKLLDVAFVPLTGCQGGV